MVILTIYWPKNSPRIHTTINITVSMGDIDIIFHLIKCEMNTNPDMQEIYNKVIGILNGPPINTEVNFVWKITWGIADAIVSETNMIVKYELEKKIFFERLSS